MRVHVDGWDGWSGIWPGPLEFIWAALGMLAMVVFWIVLAVLLVKLLKGRPFTPFHGSPALKLLEERYARGEITREEYFERRAVLSNETPPA